MTQLFHAFKFKPVFDSIPERNLPKIEVFLHESEEGKQIKT